MVAQLSQQQVVELYAMRRDPGGIGGAFRGPACHRRPRSTILYQLQEELKTAEGETMLHVRLNRRFHQAIYEAAHNRYLMQTLESLNDSFALLRSSTFRLPHRQRDSDEERRRIIAAIEKRDPDLAEHEAREHIVQAQRTRFENAAASREGGVAARKTPV